MQKNLRRADARNDRREEDGEGHSPSYFQWREQTIRTAAYQPTTKVTAAPVARLLQWFLGKK